MGTAIGNTTFVHGREQNENRETLTFQNGQEYDDGLTVSLIQAYTANNVTFPYPA